jgi:hypothetical protein
VRSSPSACASSSLSTTARARTVSSALISRLDKSGEVREIAKGIGRIDGLYQMSDGSLLATDWNIGSLFRWTEKGGIETLEGLQGTGGFHRRERSQRHDGVRPRSCGKSA